MSWWNSSNFSNLATQALKQAQKKIDKVLDIEEEEGGTSEGRFDCVFFAKILYLR